MTHRVNVTLEDEVWAALARLRQEERSRFVNQAIAKELLRSRREEAVRELERLRSRLPRLEGTAEQWIREERDSH
ncbi:MAG: hypothetical protein ACT4QB_21645 [Gammaproteobacteria bacterium]